MILIVDDDEFIRLLLRRTLERAGYEVCEASNGRTAMRLYIELKPACVITDLVMPEQEGIETIMQMRQQVHTAPIIATSGQFDSMAAHYLKVAQSLGADAVLEKPFTVEQILELVARYTGAPARKTAGV
ncbi:MAG TPA: response regulator [Candidatus Didemnitutus sp.]|nr:response regulator [Candidatus Didemnitutus sp.]